MYIRHITGLNRLLNQLSAVHNIIILLSLTCEWGECKYFDVESAHPFKCSLDHFALNCAWENTVIQLIKANKYNWNPPCE